jgi:hypothetical protein
MYLFFIHFWVLKYKMTLTVAYHIRLFHKIKFPYYINMHSSYRNQIQNN